jgi:hypothetical protein
VGGEAREYAVTGAVTIGVELPAKFNAVMLNVYETPFVSAAKDAMLTPPLSIVCVNPTGVDVIVYDIILESPISVGGVHVTTTTPLTKLADTKVGGCETIVY